MKARPEARKKGRLIALEGACGADLITVARHLSSRLQKKGILAGVSQWDASGLFFELRRRDKERPGPSPRTLLLLYANDLVFRLRWEIEPALKEGMFVIAAPYLESAFAFGKATGIPKSWVVELFRFAPAAEACYRIHEPKHPDKTAKSTFAYLENMTRLLFKKSPYRDPDEIRAKVVDYLEHLERKGGCKLLTKKIPKAAVQK